MQFEELTTSRLILRKITPEVSAYLYENLPENEFMEFMGISTPERLKKEQGRQAQGRAMFNRSSLHFLLVDRASGKTIGDCGYHTWYTDHYRAEVGYGLSEDKYKKQGFMYEALIPILEYGFNEMGLLRIEAMASPVNIASVRLLEKCGFIKEGLLRKNYFENGRMTDSVLYSLLKLEFKT